MQHQHYNHNIHYISLYNVINTVISSYRSLLCWCFFAFGRISGYPSLQPLGSPKPTFSVQRSVRQEHRLMFGATSEDENKRVGTAKSLKNPKDIQRWKNSQTPKQSEKIRENLKGKLSCEGVRGEASFAPGCLFVMVWLCMIDFTSGLVVYRSDFRRAVTWRTLVHCWLMWSGSDLAGHICEMNGWFWVLEASLPLKLDSDSGIGVQTVLRWMFPSLDVEMFANPFVGPSCHVHAQVFAQRNRGNAWVDWKASVYIRRTNLSWSDCFNLCKMALPYWTCYNMLQHWVMFSRHFFFLQKIRLLYL